MHKVSALCTGVTCYDWHAGIWSDDSYTANYRVWLRCRGAESEPNAAPAPGTLPPLPAIQGLDHGMSMWAE